MINYSEILKLCEQYGDYTVKLRRDFHKYAEPAWHEFRTTAKIAEIIEQNGMTVLMGAQTANKQFAYAFPSEQIISEQIERALSQGASGDYIKRMEGITGLTAVIDTGKPGPVTAMRFDIDCNDVLECELSGHKPHDEGFSSINPMCMHACGHDGHTAMGIVTALVLNSIKQHLCGKIKIIFQAAEEGVRGALAVVRSGVLDDADFFLSGHIGLSEKNELSVCTNTGGFLATTKFDVQFSGVPTHSGVSPEKGKNALLAAATAAIAMHNMTQDGRGAGRVNVGKMTAGSGRNVVPDTALLCAETRGYTTEINDNIYEKALKAVSGAAGIYDVDFDVKIMGGAQSSQSSPELREQIEKLISENLCPPITKRTDLGGSEDVTVMMNHVIENGGKAMHMFFNTEMKGSAHNSSFDFNENVLIFAAKFYTMCTYFLNREDN